MSDPDTLTLQFVIPAAAAAGIFLLWPRMRSRVAEAGCLSSIVATVIVAVTALVQVGVTSTRPLGLMFTFGIAFVVSLATLAIISFVHNFGSP